MIIVGSAFGNIVTSAQMTIYLKQTSVSHKWAENCVHFVCLHGENNCAV